MAVSSPSQSIRSFSLQQAQCFGTARAGVDARRTEPPEGTRDQERPRQVDEFSSESIPGRDIRKRACVPREASRSYDVAYQRWVTADNEVFTQLRTYFPDADATQDWSTFSFRMRDLYYFFRLPVTGTRGYRAFYLDHLKPWVEESCRPTCGPPADWGRLEQWLAQPSGRFDPDVSNSLSALFYAFRGRLNAIVNETLAAKAHL